MDRLMFVAMTTMAPTKRQRTVSSLRRARRPDMIRENGHRPSRSRKSCKPWQIMHNAARTLNMGIGAVMAKAAIRSKKAPVRRPWSKDDLRLLKGMARKEPLSKIARSLKRTEGATRHKATIVGISLRMTPQKRTSATKGRK
jgi:hypothetical protein